MILPPQKATIATLERLENLETKMVEFRVDKSAAIAISNTVDQLNSSLANLRTNLRGINGRLNKLSK